MGSARPADSTTLVGAREPGAMRSRPLGRLPTVDAFRGLAVLLMVVGNLEMGVRVFPAWLKHAPGVGYTVADLVAPMFVVAIAWTVGPSLRRRRDADGTSAALGHLARRALALLGIGALIGAGQALVHPTAGVVGTWNVLQALGAATLLLLPFALAPAGVRLAAGVTVLAGYQWLFTHGWRDLVVHSSHNGLPGALAWAGLLLLATAVADAVAARRGLREQLRLLLAAAAACIASALALSPWVPVAKTWGSPTYMVLSLGLCLLVVAAVSLLLRDNPGRLARMQQVGRHPLALYLANLLLLAPLTLPAADWWYAGAPLWLSLTQAAVIVLVNLWLAAWLDRRGWTLTL